MHYRHGITKVWRVGSTSKCLFCKHRPELISMLKKRQFSTWQCVHCHIPLHGDFEVDFMTDGSQRSWLGTEGPHYPPPSGVCPNDIDHASACTGEATYTLGASVTGGKNASEQVQQLPIAIQQHVWTVAKEGWDGSQLSARALPPACSIPRFLHSHGGLQTGFYHTTR
jgi:hypothetical protein